MRDTPDVAFKFRFKALLQQRRYQFEKAQSALAEARLEYERVKGRRDQMARSIEEHHRLMEQEQTKGLQAAYYLTLTEYLRSLEMRLAAMETLVAQAAQVVEEKKRLMIEREKEAKMLEILEENDKVVYRAERLQIEQKQSDETAIIKNFANKKSS
jgi:flagellar export protein FliJ